MSISVKIRITDSVKMLLNFNDHEKFMDLIILPIIAIIPSVSCVAVFL
ncbi:MAG: hypothetical protein LBB88_06185 [Planctomycetaceae bacterium]|nr:hypothetical protein [Planctomycetaceae bacterium]